MPAQFLPRSTPHEVIIWGKGWEPYLKNHNTFVDIIEPHKTPDSCLVMERQPEGLTRIYRV